MLNLLPFRARWIPLALAAAVVVGLTAVDASARGGGGFGGGGGGRGGGPGGGPGGGRGGMGGLGGRMGGMGGRMGAGFGMGRGRQGGKDAKEWQTLQNMEERKKMIAERRERLMDMERKAQQEAYLASERLASASAVTADALR